MILQEEICRKAKETQGEKIYVMCNKYVMDIFSQCKHTIPQLDSTKTFLPRNKEIECKFTTKKTKEEIIIFPKFTSGDIVVFYRFGLEDISHVMIALNEDTLIGTNNVSTFAFTSAELETIKPEAKCLSLYIDLIRVVSPEVLAAFHQPPPPPR